MLTTAVALVIVGVGVGGNGVGVSDPQAAMLNPINPIATTLRMVTLVYCCNIPSDFQKLWLTARHPIKNKNCKQTVKD